MESVADNLRHRDRRGVFVLTGAGMSVESGLKTFRDTGGLWEGHRIEEVAGARSLDGEPKAKGFHNERRRQLY